jgi:hypothetical protein
MLRLQCTQTQRCCCDYYRVYYAYLIHSIACAHAAGADKFAEAGKELRIASGLFTRLQKEELPRWVGETAQVHAAETPLYLLNLSASFRQYL